MNAGGGCFSLKHRNWSLMVELQVEQQSLGQMSAESPHLARDSPKGLTWWDMSGGNLKPGVERRDTESEGDSDSYITATMGLVWPVFPAL